MIAKLIGRIILNFVAGIVIAIAYIASAGYFLFDSTLPKALVIVVYLAMLLPLLMNTPLKYVFIVGFLFNLPSLPAVSELATHSAQDLVKESVEDTLLRRRHLITKGGTLGTLAVLCLLAVGGVFRSDTPSTTTALGTSAYEQTSVGTNGLDYANSDSATVSSSVSNVTAASANNVQSSTENGQQPTDNESTNATVAFDGNALDEASNGSSSTSSEEQPVSLKIYGSATQTSGGNWTPDPNSLIATEQDLAGDAQWAQDSDGRNVVDIRFSDAAKWENITKEYLNQPIYIFLDGKLLTAPVIQSIMSDGRSTISSGTLDTQQACETLADELNRSSKK